jgi:hypothetical protein
MQWSITTHDRLFAPSGNHLYEDEEAEDEEVDIHNVRSDDFHSTGPNS